MLKVQDIGEQGLLKRLQAFCDPAIVGDDAAVLSMQPGRTDGATSLVVTSDVLVDGVHFSDQTTAPEDAGWRAAAANLSDLAAMGATPLGITVGLAVPGETPVAWVERLYQGMTECLQRYHTSIVGGDVCRSPVISVAIAAFGQVDPVQVIRRSNAKPGDAIVVTGWHGASRAGLELLLHPELGSSLSASDRTTLIKAHQRPNPRLDVLPILSCCIGQAPATAPTISPTPPAPIAGMDSSDGLADAILQICHASQVGARVERNKIPIPAALTQWVGAEKALEWALYGGEDFELVLCLPTSAAQTLVAQLGESAAIVGSITAEPEVWLVDTTGAYSDQPLTLESGFQHFRSGS